MAEQMAKTSGYWIPMMQVFSLGVPGPSGNENDTYVADDAVYKVNNSFYHKPLFLTQSKNYPK